MAKQYLTVNGQLVMNNGKLIQVPDPDGINDLLDEQDGYATQLKQLSDDVSNLALNGLVDGTPRGSFQTLELLQTAYPDGTPGIYVITKTGEWCYYNEGWKIGGNYIEPDSGGGASITANIKITRNKGDMLGSSTEHNKLCIVSNTGDVSFKVVDKIEEAEGISKLDLEFSDVPGFGAKACTYNNEITYIFTRLSNSIYRFNTTNNSLELIRDTNFANYANIKGAFLHNEKIYICVKDTLYIFNCSSETIEETTYTIPYVTNDCVMYDNEIYILGYYDKSSTSSKTTIYKYNVVTNTLTQLSVSLPTALSNAACSIVDTNIYIIGGTPNRLPCSNYIYKFDIINNTITYVCTLPNNMTHIASIAVNSTIYLFGGDDGYGNTTYYNYILKFNTNDNSIVNCNSSLPLSISELFLSYSNGSIYVYGGREINTDHKTIYKFNPDMILQANNVLIYNANSKYSFDLITDQVTIPIKKVYIGDSNNIAQLADAYLYDETHANWVNVNTGEVLS